MNNIYICKQPGGGYTAFVGSKPIADGNTRYMAKKNALEIIEDAKSEGRQLKADYLADAKKNVPGGTWNN